MNSIEVCLSPAIFKHITTKGDFIVVIIDVLRATTSFCAAFDSGVKSVIPVSGLDKLLEFKNNGFLTAAERDGNKVDFTDFGNSPTVFLQNDLSGKELAYSTTNGTKAIEMAKSSEAIVVAAFVNLSVVCKWLSDQHKNIVILCSGWKNTFSLEDTLCAGAMVESLELTQQFSAVCDASGASLSLWQASKNSLPEAVKKANHYKRLVQLGQLDDLRHCFILNTSVSLPLWDGNAFRNITV